MFLGHPYLLEMSLFYELADVTPSLDAAEINFFLISAFYHQFYVVFVGSAREKVINNKIIKARGQDRA